MQCNRTRLVLLTMALMFGFGAVLTVCAADEKGVVQAPASTSANGDNSVGALDQALSKIEEQKKTIKDLQARIAESDGIVKKAFEGATAAFCSGSYQYF